ncbi:hypothetical protein ACH429_20985 [Streptomyces pathocidini]|uniref:Uncharacterized protein n=1 Tax=Streptomyces pathocidini TaxID=1650571 RepID=A0ABW7UYR5_9ACTN|nr:hypothetical protein [Streptomyces pathocidini]
MSRKRTNRRAARAATAAAIPLAAALLYLVPQIPAHGQSTEEADATPASPKAPTAASIAEARAAASSPDMISTLSRFFAKSGAAPSGSGAGPAQPEGAPSGAQAAPRIQGATVPVYYLAPEFVAGRPDVPVARLEFLATEAVAADGRKASVWTARQKGRWTVVNIATGDDETRYAAAGARKLRGGTVFKEPQIDAWYVQRDARVLPLDEDAVRAVGARGVSLDAYQQRVRAAYADKLPGSAYDRRGEAGGFGKATEASTGGNTEASTGGDTGKNSSAAAAASGPQTSATVAEAGPAAGGGLVTAASAATAAAAVLALGLSAASAARRPRRRT